MEKWLIPGLELEMNEMSKISPNQTGRKPSKSIIVMSKWFKSQSEEVVIGNDSPSLFIMYLKSNWLWAEAFICWCKTLVLFLPQSWKPIQKKGLEMQSSLECWAPLMESSCSGESHSPVIDFMGIKNKLLLNYWGEKVTG